MGSYVPSTSAERQQMLQEIGLKSIDDLYDVIPEEVRIKKLNIPEGKSELEVNNEMNNLIDKNIHFRSIFRGAGAYKHYIPAIVKTITGKEEFLTAYTPYQAEISQGVLQSIFEYQSQICELTGMDVANASVYDGAVAAAEAVFMCQERNKNEVLVSSTINPEVLEVVQTYCESREVAVKIITQIDNATDINDLKNKLNENTAAVLLQSPNYYGVIEQLEEIIPLVHNNNTKVIQAVNPISLGMLKTPGEYNADICVGEGQPLGLPLSFGGPYLGFMSCKKEMMRKLPGRIVGQTVDKQGRRCFVLTLQAREQHIRREKASSNICSNEALCAMTASVYLAAVGPEGLKQVAQNSFAHAHYLAQQLKEIPGFELKNDRPFFHEFLMSCPTDPHYLVNKLAEKGILAGLPIDKDILWCATEVNSKNDIDELIKYIKEVL